MLDRKQSDRLREKLNYLPPPPSKHILTLDELDWAWKEYRNESQYMSFSRLSLALGCSSSGLNTRLRNIYGAEVVDAITRRRGLGGQKKRVV